MKYLASGSAKELASKLQIGTAIGFGPGAQRNIDSAVI